MYHLKGEPLMVNESISFLQHADPELGAAVQKEYELSLIHI